MAMAEFAPAPIAERHFVRASFTGNAKEYFGIWIVNVFLTVVTLGIYSAWAKVRRNRYFYGNTTLFGHAFEYHAKPKQILIGRLIVFAFLATQQAMVHVFPPIAAALFIAMIVLFPFIFVRGLRFNARVTSYRNVRFDFLGSVRGAFAVLYLGGLMTIFSFGLLLPFATRWYYRYLFNNLRYGDRRFSAKPPVTPLYGALAVVAIFLIVSLIVVLALLTDSHPNSYVPASTHAGPSPLITLMIFIPYLIAVTLYRATVRNIIWSSAIVDGRHDLRSDMGRVEFTFIAISNIFVTLCTLGLLRPWAAVRQARYVIEHTAIRLDGEVGIVFDQIRSSGDAIGAEYLDVDGFDFGF
jgi:uncharacterized membrane protein YjgN (DUF898 family)